MKSREELIEYLKQNLDAAVADYVACASIPEHYEHSAFQCRGEAYALLDLAKFLGVYEECGFSGAEKRMVPGLNMRLYNRANKTEDGRLKIAPLTWWRYGMTPPEEKHP